MENVNRFNAPQSSITESSPTMTRQNQDYRLQTDVEPRAKNKSKPKSSAWAKALQLTLVYGFLLLIAGIVLWGQIKSQAFIAGTDSTFHMNRFYETAMQIKTGHFSYFQSLFGFAQSGRVVNALYGPMMAYLDGLLLLVTKNWVNFQIVSSLLSMSLGGLCMYLLCTHHQVKKVISLILAILYMTSYSVSIWAVAQEFTGWGSVLMPLVVWCGLTMIQKHQIKVLPLALVMTAEMQVHLISCIIGAMALVPFFIVGVCKASHKMKMITKGIEALILTMLLTGNVWSSIVSLFTSNHIIPIFPQRQMLQNAIAINGVSLNFFDPFITAILILTIVAAIVDWQRFNYVWKTTFITSILFLWISSQLFPWTWAQNTIPKFTDLIQFPRRFLVIPIILLLLAFGQSISKQPVFKNYKSATRVIMKLLEYAALITIAGLSVAKVGSTINNEAKVFDSDKVINQPLNLVHLHESNSKILRNDYSSDDLSKSVHNISKASPDYLPSNKKITDNEYYKMHPYAEAGQQYDSPSSDITKHITGHNTLTTTFDNDSNVARTMKVPTAVYKQSTVKANGKLIKNPQISDVGALEMKAQPGENKVSVKFEPPVQVKVIMLITLLAWLGVIRYLFEMHKHSPRRKIREPKRA